jgi:hypothetical protein
MAGAATTGWRVGHWNGVYLRVDDTELSWFESSPIPSLGLFDLLDVTPDRAVIDVGAGASRLVGARGRPPGGAPHTITRGAAVHLARCSAHLLKRPFRLKCLFRAG